jgi:hypothetical protein
MQIMALSGIKLTSDKLFDLSLMDEIYKAEPALVNNGVPTSAVSS